ncbi:MAG: CoA transferase subunit A [Firmicutes bacterium HGW-Firmicutes-2]|jgi:glutaconate CoA-transferase subunit A|nr:MAG: CoA transferase subunit A [Firmicutes bacterium HGW-Firmicutes-2]
MKKIISCSKAIATILDGSYLAIGGNVLHRAPMALIREIARQKKRNLKLVKTAGAHDIDVLVRAKCVASVDAGFISYETEYGLATYYRKAVESGEIKANEHACYTVISALNAAKIGVPFMPCRGIMISDLVEANDYFEKIMDPFSDEEITVIKAIKPDVAIIHVNACDEDGNAIIEGPNFEDVLMSRASKRIILSTEKIISKAQVRLNPEKIVIPSFLVESVVVSPRGCAPGSLPGKYEVEDTVIRNFLEKKDDMMFEEYLEAYRIQDQGKGGVFAW